MPIITKIAASKSSKDRYHIYLDGNYAFSVDESVLVKYGLRKGKEIDALDIEELHYEDEIQKAYNDALRFLGRKMRTEGEVRKFLEEKQVGEPIIQEVIHRLYEYQFLNDKEYAFAYVRTQINTTEKGPDVIKRELFEKGIDESLATPALEQFSKEMQIEKALRLADKYFQKNHKDSLLILTQKVRQLLFRRGYPHDIIASVMQEMEKAGSKSREKEALRRQWEKAHRKYALLSEDEYEQKMKQMLYRKGFSLDAIEEFLQEMRKE